ncbi:pseudopilin I [Gluconacetobacter tumulisoli]|uniref:Pseudopilin I n=2 Tax=Gluconacetobacter tumulisoli TaxID=1286189 RepID=A0A7W4K903_9PROT|nr:prepilin-type N-terminal cleavage/methylation domain-containing protein [Gluconacetobacter tumulisoli]MBB2202579.1 pseudopilin I [Gluconacetobacter tumulisoli]
MRDTEAGFTLIEVLIAFVIAMLALGVVYEGMVGGIAATQIANRTEEAISRAQSHLAAVGHGMRVVPLVQGGDDGSGFTWQIRIVPEQSGVLDHGPAMVLYQVEVSESWPDLSASGGRRTVVLRTRRLGTKGRAP